MRGMVADEIDRVADLGRSKMGENCPGTGTPLLRRSCRKSFINDGGDKIAYLFSYRTRIA